MRREGSVDFAYYGNGGGIVWCTGETADGVNQDAAGIREGEMTVLLAVSDGVSKSYRAEIAAQEATRVLMEKGTNDLTGNVRLASEALRGLNLPEPSTDLSEYVPKGIVRGEGIFQDDYLEKARQGQVTLYRDEGSLTTLLQLKVDKESGEVEGVFVGDGTVVIIGRDGRIKVVKSTMDKSGGMASNETYCMGTRRYFGQFSQQRYALGVGETIMLCSDGVNEKIAEAVGKLVVKSGQTNEEVAKRVALFLDQHEKGDDTTIAMYTHRRETLG